MLAPCFILLPQLIGVLRNAARPYVLPFIRRSTSSASLIDQILSCLPSSLCARRVEEMIFGGLWQEERVRAMGKGIHSMQLQRHSLRKSQPRPNI